MDLRELTPDESGPPGNPARVTEVLRAASALDDVTPFLLFPVRIETRFTQREEAIDDPLGLDRLTALLAPAADALEEIAGRDLATVLTGTVREKSRFKKRTEEPLYEFLESALADVRSALGDAEVEARNPLEGTAPDAAELRSAAARIGAGLQAARESVSALRSEFQRERFLAELDALQAPTDAVLGVVAHRTLPTAELLRELRRGARPKGPAIPPPRLADSAEAYDAAMTALAALELGLEAGRPAGPGRQVEHLAGLGHRAVEAARAAARELEMIAVLPESKRKRLAEQAEAVAARADALTGRLRRAATGGGRAAPALASLADEVEAVLARLPRGARAVPTGAGWGGLARKRVVDELLVRIMPDDIAVDAHEEALTESERDAGFTYWRETANAGSDETLARGAWRALCLKHGTRRAAWIALRTRPRRRPAPDREAVSQLLKALQTLDRRIDEIARTWPNERIQPLVRAATSVEEALDRVDAVPRSAGRRIAELTGALEIKLRGLDADPPPGDASREYRRARRQLEGLLRWLEKLVAAEAAPEDGEELEFPEVELREGSWTSAPGSPVLPSRFLVVTVTGDRASHVVAGEPVAPDLKLGLDPDPANEEAERFGLDEHGELVVAESIRWMTDYEEARRKGMAVTIRLTPEEARSGFDRVYVLGLGGGDAEEGRERVERLIDSHHFGPTGLSLLGVGTPTNNTEQEAAGFSVEDDPEAAYDAERGDPLFDPAADASEAADGARLARALGVNLAPLQHVAGAGGREIADAELIDRVLYPATFGNALEELLGAVLSLDTRDRLAKYMLAHVRGRGLLPGFRVGDQPYGLLPATAFTRFVPSTGGRLTPGEAATESERMTRFNILLRDVLLQMHEDWTRLRDAHVAHAHSPDVSDAQQHFLAMLGLQATSVASEYRFALNVARRHPLGAVETMGFGITRGEAGARATAADSGPVALLQRFDSVVRAAFDLGAGPIVDEDTGLVSDLFKDVHALVDGARAYELRLVRSPKTLTGEAVGEPAQWAPQLLASSPLDMAAAARRGDDGETRSLLYLLLRQALLLQYREAALRILAAESMLTAEARRKAGESDAYLVTSLVGSGAITRWSYLFAPLSQLDGRFDVTFPTGAGSFYDYMRATGDPAMDDYLAARGQNQLAAGFPDGQRHEPFLEALRDHAADAGRLGELPPDRLEQLLREHLDVCGHRLDVWITGLAAKRLDEMRGDAARGVYVGAYGWVEDLRPDTAHPVATGVPAELLGEGSVPVHQDLENEGFVHAPSINHAATAAILRSGYLSQVAQPDVENRMAVNLSSRRVRDALDVIAGVRAGNELGALLGYRLERFLHDAHAEQGVTLDDLIAPLRRAFPSRGAVDPALAAPETPERRVVDGLAVLETVYGSLDGDPRDATLFELLFDGGSFGGYPYGLLDSNANPLLPAVTDQAGRRRVEALLRAIDAVADTLDAVGDLVVTEAVHQIAQGNHDRAAAAVAALAEGRAPPAPQVGDTPVRGTRVSHRLLMQLERVDGRGLSELLVADAAELAANRTAAAAAGWDGLPFTPRASAEPSLNRRLGELLGPPGDLRARLFDENGDEVAEVTMEDLELQPIDLLAMVGPGLEHGLAELSTRLVGTALPADLDDEDPPSPLQLELRRAPGWGDDVKSLLEAAPLLEAVGELVGRGRPAAAGDFVLADSAATGAPTPDTDELEARMRYADAQLRALGVELIELLSAGADSDPVLLDGDPAAYLASQEGVHSPETVWAARADFYAVLLRAARFGMRQALPPVRWEAHEPVARELLERAGAAFAEVARRAQGAGAILAGLNSAPDRTAALTTAAETVFGEDFPLLPHFELRNPDEVAAAAAAGLVPGPELEGWLMGVAAVRGGAGRLSELLLLGDIFGAAVPSAQALQLPGAGGEPWLGGPFAEDDRPSGDRLSIVVFGAELLDTAGGASVGILADQWHEDIPDPRQTTGVAFHYDQPDAMPPQCLLLAVPPERRGRWEVEDLIQLLHDTLELAKNRTVELEHLHDDLYEQLLPAVIGELVPEAVTGAVTEVPGSRVILDFGVNNPPAEVPA